MTVKLENDRDRAEWLQCLQAAIACQQVWAGRTQSAITTEIASRGADDLFTEFRKRCEQ